MTTRAPLTAEATASRSPSTSDEVRVFPASLAQRRLWLLDQLEPGSTFYNLATSLRFTGALDVRALERGLDALIHRHEALRTTFASVEGTPVQRVGPTRSFALSVIDLRHLPAGERAAEASRLATAEVQRPFDLSTGPLIRGTLLRLDEQDHRLLVSIHHIVSDDESLDLLLRELRTLHGAFAAGRDSPLPELPARYDDFVRREQEALNGENLERLLAYWRQRLAGIPEVLDLPADHPRPVVLGPRRATHTLPLSAALTQGLEALARREDATLFMTLLSAFATLLHRYTAQEDLVIGAPIANRGEPGNEHLVGLVSNTLVLRNDLSGAPRFTELLGRVRESTLAALAHQALPFEKLVETLQPERSLSHSPLFQVMFALRETLPANDGPQVLARMAKVDLGLFVTRTAEGLGATFEYNTDLFDADRIQRMADHLRVLLEAVVADPQQSIAALPVMSPEERHRILVEWNPAPADYPRDRCVHEMFSEQAARTPDAIAVSYGKNVLTYRQLDERTNQLAWHLRSLGVGPEVLVGLCVGRSVDLIVGIIGVLKAGGAYMPLEANYPRERLGFMMEDASVGLILVHDDKFERLPAFSGPVVRIDSDWDTTIAKQSTRPPPSTALPDNLAYVIYTSGSTGRPKGSAIFHRGISALLFNTNAFHFEPTDRVAQASNSSFDPSTWEIWGALLHGAHLVGITEDPARAPYEFAAQIRDGNITSMFVTTAVMHLMARQIPAAFQHVDSLLFGGEAADPLALREILQHGPPRRLVNAYGPTECTVFSTWYDVTAPLPPGASVPIGWAITNGPSYILDKNLRPVPTGVPGELYIAGERLGRGYFNRPDLTARTYVPDPFSTTPGGRLYKSGDLARYMPDGRIEYLGRIDLQVKIRGFRVELGEIQELLRLHPAVKDCTVIALQMGGDRRLAAYLVPRGEHAPSTAELRTWLRERLPEHMVPSSFTMLPALPLTPNGKVDRRALPAPESARDEEGFLPPRTATEESLARLWGSLLELDRVGLYDNFFHLGGHSLLATQLVSRVNEAFRIQLPLRRIFEAPTLEAMAELIDAGRRSGASELGPELAAIPRTGALGASYAQERLWFLEQLHPGNIAYRIPISYRITSPLDVAVLERSLDALIERHETLRTHFSVTDGTPMQRVGPARPIGLKVIDLRHLPHQEREAESERLATETALVPLDLSAGPLIHATVLRLGEQEHRLLITVHHIVSDGWSLGVIMRELRTLYGDFAAGRPSSLPELTIQYADFAHWQRHWLEGPGLEKELAYWRPQLAGAPSILELPADRPRPPIHRFKGTTLSFRLSPELTRAIDALCRQEGVTLFMTLLAAFNTLLHRYTGREDLVLGAPIAGRTRPEIERIIGLFVNTLPLRNDLSGDPRFIDLLARVRETTLGAFAHQDVPFEKLVEIVQPERTLSHSPIFQVMFVLQNALALEPDPSAALQLASTAESWEMSFGTSKCDLILFMNRTAEGLLAATFEYDTDLFDGDRIQRMAGHFQILLEAIVSNPLQPLSALPLLPQAERHRILVEWNSSTADFPRDRCVHELFSEQAARTPDAIAVSYGKNALTYRQLDERSNQLAWHLRERGVGPEVLVGLCVGRSTDLIVGILGVLKAGGAYLPLEANYPRDRLSFMMEDASVALLLVHEERLERLPTFSGPVVRIDSDWGAIARQSTQAPPPSACPDNLAYVIYTSGSTGRPKGSAILHRGINALVFKTNAFHFGPEDRVAQASNASFDPSTWEIWGALLNGARLVGITEDPARAPQEFAAQIRDEGVTAMFVTTAVVHLLARQVPAAFQNVHMLVFGGEAADSLALRELFQHGPPRRLINGYGPTECTVFSTAHHVATPPNAGASVPIGLPITNGPIYILDKNLRPVPIGVPGELYVAGARLGRGYFNRPELTARTYVPDPFSARPGARLYKSGDLARFLSDGRIEYLGRIDHQVKIRGFRVELGEIEEMLRKHPAVKDCTVVAREMGGDRRLAAYLVPREEQTPSTAELRAWLRERLPEHMIPASFTPLLALPLTPNGKVDRRALPAPESPRADEQDFQAPRTPMEEALCRLWASLLELERVGLHDNFFHIGGHSLLATQLMSRIRSELGLEVPLRALFTHPTVAEMAQHLTEMHASVLPGAIPPLVRVPRDRPQPMSFSQERVWRFTQRAPTSTSYHMPYAFRLRGRVEPHAFRRTFEALLTRHEALRTSYFEEDGRPVQRVLPLGDFQLQEVDLRGREDREEEARRYMDELAINPFDLTRGLPIRPALLRLEDEEHMLFFCINHISMDGWSIGIIFRELSALYAALSEGREPALPPLSMQYIDYAVWQRNWLSGAELEQRLGYWKKSLAGAPVELNLPTDHPRPPERTFAGTHREVHFGRERSQGLHALCQREQVTPFMAVLAAFGTVLARRAGQEELVIGSPIANRLRPELESIVGMFVNGMALRINLRGNPTFRELLRRVREETLAGYAHQEVPLDQVGPALGVPFPPHRNPLFQVMVIMQNAPNAPLELPGITSQFVEVGRGGTPYELTLSLAQTPEGFGGILEYNTDLFTADTAEQLHAELTQLLDTAMVNPDLPVDIQARG